MMSPEAMSRHQQAGLQSMLARRKPRLVVSKEVGGEVAVEAECSQQGIFISECSDANVTVAGTSAQVMIQGCRGCIVTIQAAIIASLDAIDCHDCSLHVEQECGTVILDKSTDVKVTFPGSQLPTDARVFTANCARIALSRPGEEGAYVIEEDDLPVMGRQRCRMLTRRSASGLYSTDRCDLYGNVASASRASTREPSPARDGPASAMDAINEGDEDGED